MHKFVLTLITFVLLSVNVCLSAEDELRLDKAIYHQSAVMKTGFRLLNSNLYDKRITFYYTVESKPRVIINDRAKRITITKGVLPYIDNEDEMAAVLSTAIAHLMDVHGGFFRRFSMSFSPRKYEVKADKRAVDLMVNAGYNPVALIILINKTAKQPSWFEYNIFHHKGSERVAYLYQYIYEKYPLFLAKNEYLASPYYQNFLYTTKTQRKNVRMLREELIKRDRTKPINTK